MHINPGPNDKTFIEVPSIIQAWNEELLLVTTRVIHHIDLSVYRLAKTASTSRLIHQKLVLVKCLFYSCCLHL